jgi:predicted ABC-type ATPase
MPAGAIKFEKKAAILIGPPASGKSSIANPVARKMGAAIIDADDIKKTMPEYNGGIGATAVHEESSVLHEFLVRIAKADGKNIVVPKVGKSPKSIVRLIKDLKDAGYKVDLIDVAVSSKNARARMYSRFVKTGRLVPPKYLTAVGSKPSKTYDSIKSEAIADNYARIDNNGDIGEPKRIIEDEAKLLEGIDFRLRQSGGDGVPTGPARSSDRPDRQASLAEEEELISEIPLDQEIPVGQVFDEQGNPVAQVLTMRQIKEEIDADNQFLDTIGGCIK